MRAPARSLLLSAALMLAVSACSGEEAGEPTATSTATEATAAEQATATQEATVAEDAGATGQQITVADTDLGEVVVDDEGMTLYMFDPDEGGEPTCYADCAASWPPALVEGEPQPGEGVDAGLVAAVERTDGTTQITYDGWPLYRWAADQEPGDVGGQGIGGVWWVLGPDGTPMRDG